MKQIYRKPQTLVVNVEISKSLLLTTSDENANMGPDLSRRQYDFEDED
ncbi:MAG: hypothetical protein HUK02_02875 [Bacteroidaceae bacterium]|nr:hypothetical protein [Bacteroidaceae bacterium]